MGDSSDPEIYQEYRELALRGYRLRLMSIPKFDTSRTGSLLISDAAANYKLEIQSVRSDPVKNAKDIIGGAPFLDVLLALGRKPPRSLLSIFVKNPVGKRPGQETLPYGFSLSSDLGLLVVHSAYKERDMGNPREELFSEIMFRVWYEEVRGSVGNPSTLRADGLKKLGRLKYIIHEDVENTRTQKVINTVAEFLPEKIRQVQGDEEVGTQSGFLIVLDAVSDNIIEQEAFNAILGSENGRGVAYLLNQHSHAFGRKTVVQIRIFFYGTGGDNPCILFRVARLRLPQDDWKPPQLPYDPTWPSLRPHVLDSAWDSRKNERGGDGGFGTVENNWTPENIHSNWNSSKVLAHSNGPKRTRSDLLTGQNTQRSAPFQRLHKRGPAGDDIRPNPPKDIRSGDLAAYNLAANLGEDLLRIVSRPDISERGSTIITKANNNYEINYKDTEPTTLDRRGPISFMLEFYVTESQDRDPMLPRIFDIISVDNIRPTATQRRPGEHLYNFEVSIESHILIIKAINRQGDMGSPIESSMSEICYRIWVGAHEIFEWDLRLADIEDPSVPISFEQAEDLRLLSVVIIENPQDASTLSVINSVISTFAQVESGTESTMLWIEDFSAASQEWAPMIDFTGRGMQLKPWSDSEPEDRRVTKAFNALVGCESGKIVAQMLQDHSEAFGTIRIEEVVLLSSMGPDGTLAHHLLYKLGTLEPVQREDYIQGPQRDHDTYGERVEAGRKMRTDTKPSRQEDLSSAGSDLIMSKKNGYELEYEFERWSLNPQETSFIPYYLLTDKSPTVERKTCVKSLDEGTRPLCAYTLTYSRLDGLLVIKMAFKSFDRAYPKEQRFSEILYRVWFNEAHRQPRDPKVTVTSLKYIGADTIINLEFLAVARYIFKLHEGSIQTKFIHGSYGYEYIILEESSDDAQMQASFDALRATVFGRAISRMLYDHSNALGGKRITQVLVAQVKGSPEDWDEIMGDSEEFYPVGMPPFYVLFKVEAPRTVSGPTKGRDKRSDSGGREAIPRRATSIGNVNTIGEVGNIKKRGVFKETGGWFTLYSEFFDIFNLYIKTTVRSLVAKLCKLWLL
ncbi:hypothetical protein AOL_s00054g175 [Orbilia oligospora ATCC 24927]|uniref:Uncharacterized protein n=1 Tax=Arthrobotrys oligospora (strain ATCC 24927 / CBS 115.81 / DSM 1491) TaxID=756982 RepID=G1X5N1_ARTOA|nr:hypothetical protein AOL_s00054g175 [Orbilia oligospora ATCC 24927]EGX51476.1 hypothetical protein AOL_s00054g175 [Orbilia oligospora ATCC 24927]